MTKPLYGATFYARELQATLESARRVVPILINLIRPNSVFDVGCGVGAWLSVFRENGVAIKGSDGHWVAESQLLIPKSEFIPHDLATPLSLSEKFDLAISLEVAEHLDGSCADIFVKNIASLSDTIVFSAAIPGQGGTHHVNEQWPEYWAEKLESLGYLTIDCIRPNIWTLSGVASHYAQNCLLFARPEVVENNQRLADALAKTNRTNLSLVHPSQFVAKCRLMDDPHALSMVGVRVLSKALLYAIGRTSARLFSRR